MAVNAHTPAWKRLGLKLKGQDEGTAEDAKSAERPSDNLIPSSESPKINGSRSSLNLKPQSSTEKRKRKNDAALNDDGDDGSTKKKRKNHQHADKSAAELSGGQNADSETHNTKQSSQKKASTPDVTSPVIPPSSLRKTVSFSADTKTVDGDSTKRLYQDWMNSQQGGELAYQFWDDEPVYAKGKEPEATPTTAPKAEPSPSDRLAQKKAKKEERKKAREGSNTKPERPFIRYLQTYSTDRNNWKFNKTQQTTLLKNALNIHRVPPEMEEALLTYLRGLEGSAIKEKLRKTAKEVLKESEDVLRNGTMDDPKVREAAQDAALARHLLDQKKRRAERILSTIGHESNESTNGTHVNGDSSKPKKRNRKRRTDISDDDDSSSSDDSDVTMPSTVAPNDLEDESKRIKELTLKRKRTVQSKAAQDSDSDSSDVSSSSSDPSSDSDSDSDSAAEAGPKKPKLQQKTSKNHASSDSDSDSDMDAQLEMIGGKRKDQWGRDIGSAAHVTPAAVRSIAKPAKTTTKKNASPKPHAANDKSRSSGSSDSSSESDDDDSESGVSSSSDESSTDKTKNKASATSRAPDSDDDDDEMKILMEDQFGGDRKGKFKQR